MPAKAKASTTKVAPTEVDKVESNNELERIAAIYNTEVGNSKVEQLTEENEMLRTIAKELRLRLDKHIQAQTQLVSHLKSELDGRNYQIKELQNNEAKLEKANKELSNELSASRMDYEKQIASESQEKNKVISDMKEKYNKLKDFEGKKFDLQQMLEHLQEEIKEERRKHIEHVAALDRRNMMQKDRLKNEMLRKIRETKLSLLAMTEDQLHTTTKRTIMENEQMTTELQYQSRETEKIIKRNAQLESQNKALRRQMELAQDAQKTLAKRTRFYQKQIKTTQELLKSTSDENSRLSTNVLKRGYTSNSTKHHGEVHSDEKYKRLETHIGEMEETIKGLNAENSLLRDDVATAKHAAEELLNLQDEATTFILTCIQEVKQLQHARKKKSGNHIMNDVLVGIHSGDALEASDGKWTVSDSIPASLYNVTPPEREQILELLFQKLNYYDTTQDHKLLAMIDERNKKKEEDSQVFQSFSSEKSRYKTSIMSPLDQ